MPRSPLPEHPPEYKGGVTTRRLLVALGLAVIAVLVLDAGSSPDATADDQRQWQPGSVTAVTQQVGDTSTHRNRWSQPYCVRYLHSDPSLECIDWGTRTSSSTCDVSYGSSSDGCGHSKSGWTFTGHSTGAPHTYKTETVGYRCSTGGQSETNPGTGPGGCGRYVDVPHTHPTTPVVCTGNQHVDGTGRGCHNDHVEPPCHCTLNRAYNRHDSNGRHERITVYPCDSACTTTTPPTTTPPTTRPFECVVDGQHVDGTGRGCHNDHVEPPCHCTLTGAYNRHVNGRHVHTEVPPCDSACSCSSGQHKHDGGSCHTETPPPCPSGEVSTGHHQCGCASGQHKHGGYGCHTETPPPCLSGEVSTGHHQCGCAAGDHKHGGYGCHTETPPPCPLGEVSTGHHQCGCASGQHKHGGYGCHTETPPPCPSGEVSTGHHQCQVEITDCPNGEHRHGAHSCHADTICPQGEVPTGHHQCGCPLGNHKHGIYGCHAERPPPCPSGEVLTSHHQCGCASGDHKHDTYGCHANTSCPQGQVSTGHHTCRTTTTRTTRPATTSTTLGPVTTRPPTTLGPVTTSTVSATTTTQDSRCSTGEHYHSDADSCHSNHDPPTCLSIYENTYDVHDLNDPNDHITAVVTPCGTNTPNPPNPPTCPAGQHYHNAPDACHQNHTVPTCHATQFRSHLVHLSNRNDHFWRVKYPCPVTTTTTTTTAPPVTTTSSVTLTCGAIPQAQLDLVKAEYGWDSDFNYSSTVLAGTALPQGGGTGSLFVTSDKANSSGAAEPQYGRCSPPRPHWSPMGEGVYGSRWMSARCGENSISGTPRTVC